MKNVELGLLVNQGHVVRQMSCRRWNDSKINYRSGPTDLPPHDRPIQYCIGYEAAALQQMHGSDGTVLEKMGRYPQRR